MNAYLNYYLKNNYYTNKFESIIKDYAVYDRLKILDEYNKKFLNLFNTAISYSTFYKNYYMSHGIYKKDIRSIDDIEKLPIITNEVVRDNFKKFPARYTPFQTNGYTSGTTGTPLTIKRDFNSIVWEQAYINYYRSLCGFKKGEPLISLRGKLGKNNLFKQDYISNVLYISTPALNKGNALHIYELISRFKPKAIEGYPSYLYKLCEELDFLKLSLNIPIVFTSSETLSEFFSKKIKKILNAIIYDWYGNAERTIALVQNDTFKYYPLPLYSLNEYYDNHLITTSLINNYFPLIRYQVNDVVSINSKDKINNFIHPDIITINGRNADSIQLKDGSIVACIDYVFKEIDYLEVAQVYQLYPGSDIDIKIVTGKEFGSKENLKLLKRIKWILGEDIGVNIIKCSKKDLVFSDNGKFKLIIKGN